MEWRQVIINGVPFHYEVSDDGMIRNTNNGYLLRPQKEQKGYLAVKLYNNDIRFRKWVKVHRVVANAFIPNPNNYPQVNHINGIKNDNRVENLEWCTGSQNMLHAYHHGLKHACPPVGEKNHLAKHTDVQIKWVCDLLASGKTCAEVSEITGISKPVIGGVMSGQHWKHISKGYDFSKSRKYWKFKKTHIAIDRAILKGVSSKKIENVLVELGFTRKQSHALYGHRMRALRKGISIAQCDAYIDDSDFSII